MKKQITLAIIALAFLAACVTKHQDEQEESATEIVNDTSAVIELTDIFYAVPSPLELSTLFKIQGIEFDKSHLLALDAVNKYEDSEKRALILGVYGADLSYTGIFRKTQESIQYMAVCKKLSDNLGIGQGFDEKMVSRLEANVENKDSIVSIIGDSFLDMDTYFKENKQGENSALVVIGGWIEGLYLGTTMINSSADNDGLKRIIKDQKEPLSRIIKLAENQNFNSQKGITADLKSLSEIFSQIPDAEEGDATMKKEGEMMVLGSTASENVALNDSTFQSIKEKVKNLRNQILKL